MTINQDLISFFKKNSFEISEAKGCSRHSEMIAINKEGIQFTIQVSDEKNMLEDIEYLNIMLENKEYLNKIKSIYFYLKELSIGDIWVMVGGGSQIQAFFGNSKGYIAILYLDIATNVSNKPKKHTLQVNGKNNDKYFNGKVSSYQQKNVIMRTHVEVYGVSAEDLDEEYQLVYGE